MNAFSQNSETSNPRTPTPSKDLNPSPRVSKQVVGNASLLPMTCPSSLRSSHGDPHAKGGGIKLGNLNRQSGRKDLPNKLLRHLCVSVRLNETELAHLDAVRGKLRRGESLRMLALSRLPRPVPEANMKLVLDLSRSLGDLATVEKFLRRGTPDHELVTDAMHQVRVLMKILKRG